MGVVSGGGPVGLGEVGLLEGLVVVEGFLGLVDAVGELYGGLDRRELEGLVLMVLRWSVA